MKEKMRILGEYRHRILYGGWGERYSPAIQNVVGLALEVVHRIGLDYEAARKLGFKDMAEQNLADDDRELFEVLSSGLLGPVWRKLNGEEISDEEMSQVEKLISYWGSPPMNGGRWEGQVVADAAQAVFGFRNEADCLTSAILATRRADAARWERIKAS